MPLTFSRRPLLFTRFGAVTGLAVLAVPLYVASTAGRAPIPVLHEAAAASSVIRPMAPGKALEATAAPAATGTATVHPSARGHRTARLHRAKAPARAKRPGHPAAPHGKARAAARKRWLPTGTGMWTHIWARTDGGDPRRVIRHAQSAGLSTIFVRTGSSHDGFVGGPALRGLLPRVRGTGVHVVAWDFPTLADPVGDARRLARAARFGRTARSRVMAVAPDIETRSEGAHTSAARVRNYLWHLRRMLPADVAILGTTPWPSRYRVGSYPYAQVAHFSDALLPMAYWYDNSSAQVTLRSMRYLKRFGKPVMPVGQGYDSRIDVPSLPPSHPIRELHGFFSTAKRSGARGVSLWSWQTAGHVQWVYLSRARHGFPARG